MITGRVSEPSTYSVWKCKVVSFPGSRLPAAGGSIRPARRAERGEEDLAGEVIDLKKALNTARQDLQMEKVTVV
jgi:hypothetical protein